MKKIVAGGALLGMVALLTVSARAQNQRGLVNVNVSDVTVQVPVGVAANICDVNVNVLASALASGPTDCQAGTIALADNQEPGGPPARQQGLINVNLMNVDAQVPVSVAANICGVRVNVLVSLLRQGPVDCTAFGRSAAVSR
jgi:hypothetical protein